MGFLLGGRECISACEVLFLWVSIQRSMVHKIKEHSHYCPKSLKGMVVNRQKRVFYVSSKEEALRDSVTGRSSARSMVPKAVICFDKDLL
jgi:hypothetical protein